MRIFVTTRQSPNFIYSKYIEKFASNIDGIDYQILIEADFLVNASESNFSKVSIENAKSRIFKTTAGCRLLESIFLREE